ncbi:hypothetical protein TNCV_3548141 [Trichonephila clavipes]|nr:hypothetical protein TNCV_3548141 [Trichonephila clavipes]
MYSRQPSVRVSPSQYGGYDPRLVTEWVRIPKKISHRGLWIISIGHPSIGLMHCAPKNPDSVKTAIPDGHGFGES